MLGFSALGWQWLEQRQHIEW